jgi:hypothetical protein
VILLGLLVLAGCSQGGPAARSAPGGASGSDGAPSVTAARRWLLMASRVDANASPDRLGHLVRV